MAFNSHWDGHELGLPLLPDGRRWHVAVNTGMAAPDDVFAPGAEPALENQLLFFAGPRSAVVLVGR